MSIIATGNREVKMCSYDSDIAASPRISVSANHRGVTTSKRKQYEEESTAYQRFLGDSRGRLARLVSLSARSDWKSAD